MILASLRVSEDGFGPEPLIVRISSALHRPVFPHSEVPISARATSISMHVRLKTETGNSLTYSP